MHRWKVLLFLKHATGVHSEIIKSRNWGIAAFYECSTPPNYVELTFDKGLGNTRTSYRWKPKRKVMPSTGPSSEDLVISEDDKPNLCLFLRGYKIMLRQDLWDRLDNTLSVSVHSRDGKSSKEWADSKTCNQLGHGTSSNRSRSDGSMRREGGHVEQDQPGSMDQESDSSTNCSVKEVILEEDLSTASPVRYML